MVVMAVILMETIRTIILRIFLNRKKSVPTKNLHGGGDFLYADFFLFEILHTRHEYASKDEEKNGPILALSLRVDHREKICCCDIEERSSGERGGKACERTRQMGEEDI